MPSPKRGVELSWEETLLRILNSPTRDEYSPRKLVRGRGFVVVVRNALSLEPIQALCLRPEAPDCLTARYRFETGPVFSTLFAAFISDTYWLTHGLAGEGQHVAPAQAVATSGVLQWDPSRSRWPKLIRSSFLENTGVVPEHTAGQLRPDALLGALEHVPRGLRVVLLCEVAQWPEGTKKWEEAVETLFPKLPHNLGLIISGVPLELKLPPDDPDHYLELELPPGAGDRRSGAVAYRYRPAALRSDRPAEEDRLRVQPYAAALAQLVLLEGTTPLTIGIHGRWGTGKSSFMRFVDDALVQLAPANSRSGVSFPRRIALTATIWRLTLAMPWSSFRSLPVQTRRRMRHEAPSAVLGRLDEAVHETARALEATADEVTAKRLRGELDRRQRGRERLWRAMRAAAARDVVGVQFNAWRYEDSVQIWAGLASAITERLEAALSRPRRLATPLAYAFRNRRVELVLELLLPALAATVLAVLAAVGIPWLRDWLDGQLQSEALVRVLGGLVPGAATVLAGVWIVFSRARRVLQPLSERVLTYTRRPDYRERMGYQHLVLGDVRFVLERLRRGRAWPRVVVFIDDLDRCSDGKIMEILQAINLILGESEFFVFLGIDTEMVHGAIARHYGAGAREGIRQDFPAHYLRKIVQLSFHLPPVRERQRGAYLAALLSGTEHGVQSTGGEVDGFAWDLSALGTPLVMQVAQVEDTPAELQSFRELGRFLEGNPRELKRLVNLHRLVKILLYPAGASRPPPEAAQRKLVKWLVFCARWPTLIDAVLTRTARAWGGSTDEIEALAADLDDSDGQKSLLAAFAKAEEPLTGVDLAPGGMLAHAAWISQLVEAPPHRADH